MMSKCVITGVGGTQHFIYVGWCLEFAADLKFCYSPSDLISLWKKIIGMMDLTLTQSNEI